MNFLSRLTPRERVIVILTISFGLFAFGYYAFFADFMDRYQIVTEDLEVARREFETSRLLLADAARVDREYDAIAATLPQAQEGKSPDMIFTEEVDALAKRLNLSPQPTIKQPEEPTPVPGVDGFYYLVLPVENIQGDLQTITNVLLGFYRQNFLIQDLTITAPAHGARDLNLKMDVKVAQIIRDEQLDPSVRDRQRPAGRGRATTGMGFQEFD